MESETGKIRVSLTEDRPLDDKVRGSLQTYIAGLAVPQKVELATKGNKEVRQILSRDPNRMVARAVIGSPRLSENDVMAYAASALTNEEVLRAIGENREWMSNLRLQTALVSNPRTPVPVALRLLPRLPLNELNLLCRNSSVSALVRREAKRLAVKAR
ncbi:MAG: hypothetical protein HZA60_04490 [Deltaproteobacteria bacterium]|nr:hypothetical protein [Deltaproteobacteria bacterium]